MKLKILFVFGCAESSLLLRLFPGRGGRVLLGNAGFSRCRAQALEH